MEQPTDSLQADSSPEEATRRSKWQWVGSMVAFVVASAVLGGILLKVPYVALVPGSARDTEPLLEVEGIEAFPSEGELLLTTVRVRQRPNLWEYLWLQTDDDAEIVPEEVILGDRSPEENREFNLQLMTDSKSIAIAVALEELGYDAIQPDGVTIVELVPDAAAEDVLELGDTVVAIDGVEIMSSGDLVEVLGTYEPGDEIELLVDPFNFDQLEADDEVAAADGDEADDEVAAAEADDAVAEADDKTTGPDAAADTDGETDTDGDEESTDGADDDAAAPTGEPVVERRFVTVESGDSLWSISVEVLAEDGDPVEEAELSAFIEELVERNDLVDPNAIEPGQELELEPIVTAPPPQIDTDDETEATDTDPDDDTDTDAATGEDADGDTGETPGGTSASLAERYPDAELVSVELGAKEDDPDAAFLGVGPTDRVNFNNDFDFLVDIDSGSVGGPSAGLAFTLAVLDQLTEGELTGGATVAVTGTIDPTGRVGPVGGVAQKTAAVRDLGADVFLVPAGLGEAELERVFERAGDDLEVIPVEDLDDALEALAEFGGEVAAVSEFAASNPS